MCNCGVVLFARPVFPISKPIFFPPLAYQANSSPRLWVYHFHHIPAYVCMLLYAYMTRTPCLSQSVLRKTSAPLRFPPFHIPGAVASLDDCWALWRNPTAEGQLGITNNQPQTGSHMGWAIWITWFLHIYTHVNPAVVCWWPGRSDSRGFPTSPTPAVQTCSNSNRSLFSLLQW